MKERLREKITPIHLMPNDGIELTYVDGAKRTTVIRDKVGRKMTLNEAVIFDVEKGDFGDDVEDGIGGAFLSIKSEAGK